MRKILVLGLSPLPIENEIMLSGPGIRTWQFVKPLLEDENKVCLICVKGPSNLCGQSREALVKERIDKNLTYYSMPQEKFGKISNIQKIHDDFKPDCIFSISSFLPSYAAAQIKTDKPIWFDRGDLMAEAQLKSAVDSEGDFLYPFWKLEKLVLEKGDIFSSVSSPQKFALIGRLGAAGRLNRYTLGYEFVNVIPCAIERGNYLHTKNVIRGKYVNDKDFVILWSGGYNTWADIDILFKALEMAMAENKRIYYVSTGGAIPGQDETTYLRFLKMIKKSRYKDRYIMLGWVPTNELPNIYLESNLAINIDKNCYEVILGSRHRLLDWMKAGLPILTTKPSEFIRTLDARKLVFTYMPNNSESLSRAIVKLSSSPKILAQYAKKAKSFAAKELSYEMTTRSFREWVKNPKYAPDKIIDSKDKRCLKSLSKKYSFNIGREYVENAKLKLKIKRIAAECENLKNHASNLEKDRDNLKNHISNLEAKEEVLDNHTANLEKERDNHKNHASNLEQKQEALNNHIFNLEKERDNHKNHISNLEIEQEALNKHAFNLEKERDNHKNHISNLEMERDALIGRINRITSTFIYKIYKGIKKYIIAIKKNEIPLTPLFINTDCVKRSVKGWSAKSSTTDPQIFLYDNKDNPIVAANYQFITFDLFASQPAKAQLFWWLTDNRWQGSRHFSVGKGWNRYHINMHTILTKGCFQGVDIRWEGEIYRIRLDPAEESGVVIKFKNAKLTSKMKRDNLVYFTNSYSEPTSYNIQLNYEECKLLPLTLKSKPVLIYAEISTKCNLRCKMCGRAHYNISEDDQGFMDRNVFEKLSTLFTPNTQLALFGRGETLLHPDFIYFLKIASKAGMRVGFNTNGLLLTEEIAKAMVKYGQTHITFSCSAGTPQTYREIHGVNAWKKLWSNIKMLNDAKIRYGPAREDHSTQDTLPVIYMEFVAQRSNIKELPALVSMAYNYAVKGLMVIDVVAHSDKMEEERMNTPENQPIAEEYYKKASAVCEDLIRQNGRDFDLRLPNSYSSITKKFSSEFEKSMLKGVGGTADNTGSQLPGNGFCVEPWRTFYVRFDGTIAPCVITGRSLGDLNTAAAAKIWNGKAYSKFRARMKAASKPYECLRCHLFPGPKRYDTGLGDISQYEPL